MPHFDILRWPTLKPDGRIFFIYKVENNQKKSFCSIFLISFESRKMIISKIFLLYMYLYFEMVIEKNQMVDFLKICK